MKFCHSKSVQKNQEGGSFNKLDANTTASNSLEKALEQVVATSQRADASIGMGNSMALIEAGGGGCRPMLETLNSRLIVYMQSRACSIHGQLSLLANLSPLANWEVWGARPKQLSSSVANFPRWLVLRKHP